MAILYKNESSLLVCPLQLFKKYSNAMQRLILNIEESSLFHNLNNSLIEETFEIKTPFFMDGEAKKIAKNISLSSNERKSFSLNEFFKLKNTTGPSNNDQLLKENNSLLILLEKDLLKFRETYEFSNYFNHISSGDDYYNNNLNVRKATEKVLELSDFPLPKFIQTNEKDAFAIQNIGDQKYLIPPKSCYICGDIKNLASFLNEETFDYIIMDPPWKNKHIRRRKKARGLSHSYNMLSVDELMKMPLQRILSNTSIVLIWITNCKAINEEFIKSLPLWDLELVTTWYWMKLTKCGEPVVHTSIVQSRGKLPYEKILVTRRKSTTESYKLKIPVDFIIYSIPSGIHSYKPPLHEVLSCTLGLKNHDKCLEIFARSLIPGWTSFGLEALKFQNVTLLSPS